MIYILQAEGHRANEIHHQLDCMHNDNVMSDGCERDWCRKFKDGCTNVHDEEQQGWHNYDWWTQSRSPLSHAWERLVSQFQIFLMNFLKFQVLVCFKLLWRDWVTNEEQWSKQPDEYCGSAIFLKELQKLVPWCHECLNFGGD